MTFVTFVEIFIFKHLSDLGVLTGMHSFSNLLDQYKTNSDNDVLDYYVAPSPNRHKSYKNSE